MSAVDADTLRTGIDLEVVELAGSLQGLDDRVVGRGDAVVDFDIAHRRVADGNMIEPLSTPLSSTHLASAAPAIAAADASWPVWLMPSRL